MCIMANNEDKNKEDKGKGQIKKTDENWKKKKQNPL